VTLKNRLTGCVGDATHRAIAQLKAKVFRWFQLENPVEAKGPRGARLYAKYADYKEVSFQSEDGVRIGQLLTPKQQVGRATAHIRETVGRLIYFMTRMNCCRCWR